MMRTRQCTCSADLSAIGHELAEEHLRLAAGGLTPAGTGGRTYLLSRPTYRDGMIVDGCIPDY